MEFLWKKNTAQTEYVDPFASVKDPFFNIFVELLKTKITQKDNQRSNKLRSEGNEFFRQEKWIEAIKCYSRSLCFAENGSENVALAYANRSACYFRMMMFEKVLIDIGLAMNANLPDRLRPKLERRKNESLKMKPMVIEGTPTFEAKLDYTPDKNFPCMANVVEIKCNQEFGRHLVANCDIPVGKTILVENDIPRIRDDELVCYTCLRVYTNCVACPNCADVAFCSFDCMNRNQIHKFECGTFFPHLPSEMRFRIKILLLAIASFRNVHDLMQFVEDALLEDPEQLPLSLNDPKSKYHFFFKLKTSSPYYTILIDANKIYEIAMNLPKVSSLFNNDRKKHFLMHLIIHHTLISNTNAIRAENSKFVAYVASLLNHSCAPNIIGCVYASSTFSVTGRPIKKGEQLFFNYLGVEPSKAKRTFELKSRWGFDCKCENCEPSRASLDSRLTSSDPSYKFVVNNQNNMDLSANVQKNCINFLSKYGRSTWSSEIEAVFNIYANHLAYAKLV